jgi:hypothetical protein
VEINI